MMAARAVGILPGSEIFKLHDPFGVRAEFVEDVMRKYGLAVAWEGCEAEMGRQGQRARASWKRGAKEAAKPIYAQIASAFGPTGSDFYRVTTAKDCKIEAIVKAGTSVSQMEAGETAEVILDRTAIYAESGGQVADIGAFYDNSESQLLAEVTGAFYPVAGTLAPQVVAKGAVAAAARRPPGAAPRS